MPSNYEKRQAKSAATVAKEIQERREQIRSKVVEPAAKAAEAEQVKEPVYTQMAYDVYTPDGGKTYKVAEISYNPVTKEAEVKEIFNITRLVALQYANTKVALGTLKKKAIKEE